MTTIRVRGQQAQTQPARRPNIQLSRSQGAARQAEEQGRINAAVQKAQDDADSLMLTEFDNNLSDFENTLMWGDPATVSTLGDPAIKQGAMREGGRDAMSQGDKILGAYDKKVGELVAGLASPRVRALAEQQAASRRAGVNKQLLRHADKEATLYDQAQTNAVIANSIEAASNNFTDPTRINVELLRQSRDITAHGVRNDLPEEQIAQEIRAAHSATHIGVLNRFVDMGLYERADEYFTANKNNINSKARSPMEANIEAARLDGESQKRTDEIVATSDSRKAALTEARKINDTKMRDRVVQRVNARFDEAEKIEREANDALYDEAMAQVESSRGTADLPARITTKLSSAQNASLENRARNLRQGIEPNQNWALYTEFVGMSDNQMKQMSEAKYFETYREHFDDVHFERGLNALRQAKETGSANGTRIRTPVAIGNDKLQSIGIDTSAGQNKTEAEQTDRFFSVFTRRIDDEETAKGRKLTELEMNKIADELIIKGVTRDAAFFGFADKDTFVFEVEPGADFAIEDVPDRDKEQIIDALQRAGETVTVEKIIDIYTRKNAGALLNDN